MSGLDCNTFGSKKAVLLFLPSLNPAYPPPNSHANSWLLLPHTTGPRFTEPPPPPHSLTPASFFFLSGGPNRRHTIAWVTFNLQDARCTHAWVTPD